MNLGGAHDIPLSLLRKLGESHCEWLLLFSDDDNRIALKSLPGSDDCQRDYINACYVDVSEFS